MLSPHATDILAWLVVIGLLAAFLAWVAGIYRGGEYTLAQFPLYMLNETMSRILWRARVEGHMNLAPGEGAVVVSNHIGPIDPAFVGLATPRGVHWLVAAEYFTVPFFGGALRALQAIPTKRSGIDTAATKLAMRYVAKGETVGLFPEGRINASDKLLLPGRPGAALIALKTRGKVFPVYLHGTPYDGTDYGFLFMSAKARVVIGKPIDISAYYGREGDRRALEEVTRLFLKEIAKLGGQPDFEPEIAGRIWNPKALPLPEGVAERRTRERRRGERRNAEASSTLAETAPANGAPRAADKSAQAGDSVAADAE